MSVRRRNRSVIMDPAKTGIVWARKREHPLRRIFDSVPARWPDHPEVEMPPADMPPEMKQILAIHLFDNLRFMSPEEVTDLLRSVAAEIHDRVMHDRAWTVEEIVDKFAPEGPVYKLVKNPNNPDAPMGVGGSMWVPIGEPDEKYEAQPMTDDGEDLTGIPIDEMTDEQLDVMQRRLDERHVERARRADLDQPDTVAPPAEEDMPDWMRERQGILDRAAERAARRDAELEAEAKARPLPPEDDS